MSTHESRTKALEQQVAELTKQLAEAHAVFHVNMLRAWPEKSHDEIMNAIGKVSRSQALETIKAESFQAGRDSYQKQMSEQEPVGFVYPEHLRFAAGEGAKGSIHKTASPARLAIIIRPEAPKEKP